METIFSLFSKKSVLVGCAVIGATAAGAWIYSRWNAKQGGNGEKPEPKGLESVIDQEGTKDSQGPEKAGNGSSSQAGTSGEKPGNQNVNKPTFGGMRRGFLL